MRSAILGVYFCDAPAARRRFVDASSTLTHTDERALAAARSIAEIAAALSSGKWRERPNRKQLELVLSAVSSDTVWLAAVQLLISLLETPLSKAALHFGGTRGVSGYALHSVPIAILAWHQHYGDYPAAIEAAIRCGGDVDTIAAIAGSLAGITAGPTGIPIEWQDRLADWPHSVTYLHKLSRAISPGDPSPTHFSPWLFPRGIVFTLLVLLHGLGRLLPDRPAGASGE